MQFDALRLAAILFATTLLLIVTGNTSLAAGPSSKNPQMLLSPWTDESVGKRPVDYYSAAAALYEQAAPAVESYEAAIKAGKVKSLNLIKVGTTASLVGDLAQYSLRLIGWGEPAGQDLSYRAHDLDQRLQKVRSEMLSPNQDAIHKGLVVLQKRCKQQEKLVKLTRELIEKGQLDAAEQKFQGEYRKLAAMAYWYDYQQRLAPMKPYDETYDKLNKGIEEANKQEARKVIEELCDKTRPELKKLPADLAKAATALGAAAEAEFDGKTLSGPKVFMSAAKQWYGLHRATLRTIGMHWAIADRASGLPAVDEVVAAYATYRTEMLKALASVIEADAARASESEAATLYAEYVKGIADITSVSRDEELSKAFDGPLQELAAKSPALSADREAYLGATGDWLRWRSRVAEVSAASKRLKSPECTIPLKESTNPTLSGPAPELISRLSAEGVGKELSVAADFFTASKSGPPTSGYLEWTICRAMVDKLPTDPTLEQDLLATPETPPLSLVAASALATLKRGMLVEVGGKLNNIELTGLIPFYAVDSEDRKSVVPMGQLPPIATGGYDSPVQRLQFIAELEPTWVRGEYFFAEVQ